MALETVERQIEHFLEELNDEDIKALYAKLPVGKRLRAKLLLKIADASDEAVRTAAIIEMIHAASLLHDDVIDEAHSRRGVASINATYGNKHAIMLGDILYSKAYSELTRGNLQIAEIVSSAVTQLSIGELKDVDMAKRFNEDEKLYLDMIYKKTAVLIEASAKAGAILAGKEPESYGRYGRNLGVAFQIVDDILDITQDSATLGKPALNDFVEGKATLPYIYLYRSLDASGKEQLLAMHGKKLDAQQQEWIKTQMQRYGCVEQSFALAKELIEEAVALMGAQKEEYLVSIAREMIERNY